MTYITKRFDVASNGTKYCVGDFASLAGLTSDNAGKEFKYNILSDTLTSYIMRMNQLNE